MGCSSCGKRAASAVTYPRNVIMPDGSSVEVTSASDERAQRARVTERMRQQGQARGYTVTRR